MSIQHHDALETQTLARERKISATEATLPLLPAPHIDWSLVHMRKWKNMVTDVQRKKREKGDRKC
jgi:hypothetical protein